MHIHSRYSDGTGTPDEIVTAGQRAGLDYLIITDHHTLLAREHGCEGWHGDVLVSVGEEVAVWSEHCLSIGARTRMGYLKSATRMIEAVEAQGGISIVAHPHGRYRRWSRYRSYPWETWNAPFTGIELWSYMWDWIKDFKRYNPFNFLPRYLNPDRFLHGPHPETLRIWDELTRRRKVVAIGGLDAHARRLAGGLFVIFPYHRLFRTILTYILTDTPFRREQEPDLAVLYHALRTGHCYMSFDALHPGHDFVFRARNAEGESGIMGDALRFIPPVELHVDLPRPADGCLVRNGVVYERFTDQYYTRPVSEPGVYRVEVRVNGQPWIYSNPIYLRTDPDKTRHPLSL